jgi:aminoglycoside phosphotransferase (APT) family kinase protein
MTEGAAASTEVDAIVAALACCGVLPAPAADEIEALAGGVSSDIVRIRAGALELCVKRALPRLKVAADWRAPVERNHSEAQWLRVADAILPGCAPRLLAEDRAAGWFAMDYLPPDRHPVWKIELRDGRIDTSFAAEVGRRLARLHAATANRSDIARRFANDHIFHPIRLEAYLLATADRHPALAPALRTLVDVTAGTKRALVHGDVSPKNILVGPAGPVFLDAECAWYGDPAFDLAFCLNHLLLKGAWRPQWKARYLECYAALAAAYLRGVDWEEADALEARAARLLPGLLLARVDGKSPVEYLTDERDRERVRSVASALLREPVARLDALAERWADRRAQAARAGGIDPGQDS